LASVFLALGSNLGNRRHNIEKALHLLKEKGIIVEKMSSIIETDPVGGPPHQEQYLNAVIQVETKSSPVELLQTLQSIELQLGRTRDVVHGARTIDLDILFYDNLKINTPQLTIPHPRMGQRFFVLEPLKEISPEKYKELVDARC
jgi:2-amino-4-hydroxy-6-hydroxymethyldihydropteridine diphosphokinase